MLLHRCGVNAAAWVRREWGGVNAEARMRWNKFWLRKCAGMNAWMWQGGRALAGANWALARKEHVHERCKFSIRVSASWAKSRTAGSHSESVRGSKLNYVASKRLIFRKNGPVWEICESAIKLFLLDFCSDCQWVPTFLDLLQIYSTFCSGVRRQILN